MFAQPFCRDQFKTEIELGEFQHFHRHETSCGIRRAQFLGGLPDSFFWDEWRFESARVVHGWLALLMISVRFSKSSREGFWPESVRKKAGSLPSNSSSFIT